ncbi:S9 family peptidase [Alkalihalobacillus pseudalcaliphilus]|uniref:S9 family peptidase n=1 Tax=Alkalihalobacillus pseudalcaliphilus TaxID=79884 RepID=UPI00064E0764|nr:S9 family peptidase [Alkalihalobacillus pseudalcaliphilus]KMK75156.1 hypothetical protein AB990_17075 [Alkalihalobacillus pseudalcaliphilus]
MSKRPITIEDLCKLTFVGNPVVSPKKDKIVYVRTVVDQEKDGYASSLYLVDLEGNEIPLTTYFSKDTLIKDTSPKWSPDGQSVAFLSNRTGKNQVWKISTLGGEAIALTDVDQGISNFEFSPDGQSLALTISGEWPNEDKKEDQKEESDVKVITRLRYKADGVGILSDKRNHIYLYDLKQNSYTKLTEGEYDFSQPRFSSNGTGLFYVATKAADKEWGYLPSIWYYDLSTKTEKNLYEGKGTTAAPSVSPDGKWLAFIGHTRGERSQGNNEVLLLSLETGKLSRLTKDFDYTVGNLVGIDARYDSGDFRLIWDETSEGIYFSATIGGDCLLFKVDLHGHVSKPLTPAPASITSFDLINQKIAIAVIETPTETGKLVKINLESQTLEQNLSHWNQTFFEEVFISEPEPFTYQSTDEKEIEGWLLKPYGFKAGKKYPLILQIHGGPATAYGNGLHHEMQVMAAKGYLVLYTNPRGSQGYGHDFVNAVIGDYGGMDYADIIAGLDYALEHYNFIDKEQLFVTGGSYGGYMTNVIVTRTNRFKAAVTQRSICNWHSFYGTSDIGFFFTEWQHGHADLWNDYERLIKLSPLHYARNVKTPILILHSEQDLRCPMEQAEQWYIALKRLGVETKFVRFPDENHDLSRSGKPKHRLKRLEHLIGWFLDRTAN